MANSKKYYWLKLKRDFFKRHDIRIIEAMPNGKDYILFYLKLLLESVDHEGSLRFSETIPYNEQMLSVVTETNIDIVRAAMKLFSELKMVEILDDSTIYMNEVQKMIGSETKWAEYKRNKKISVNDLPQLGVCKRVSYEQILLPNGTLKYVDEKRYGGNGGLAYERAQGKCEVCGSEENLVIHHANGYSNELEDLVVCCKKCHAQLEKFQRESKSLPIEIDIEKETDKEKRDKSITRHKYGEYKNVLLSDEDLSKLKAEFPDWEARIERLSSYIASTGKKYKSHLATIRNWARNDKPKVDKDYGDPEDFFK